MAAPQEFMKRRATRRLSWTDGGGSAHALTFLPGSLRASAIADARACCVSIWTWWRPAARTATACPSPPARSQLHLRRDPKADAMDLQVSGDEIKTQGNIAGLFGDHITHLAIYATLTQGAAFAPLLAGTATWAGGVGGLARQRRAGGDGAGGDSVFGRQPDRQCLQRYRQDLTAFSTRSTDLARTSGR